MAGIDALDEIDRQAGITPPRISRPNAVPPRTPPPTESLVPSLVPLPVKTPTLAKGSVELLEALDEFIAGAEPASREQAVLVAAAYAIRREPADS